MASAAAAGLARTLMNARLSTWGCAHISDDAALIASELITNAINETPGKEIRYRMSLEGDEVLLAVWDSSERTPYPKEPAHVELDLSPEGWDDNGGWGLSIVTALAVSSGYTIDPGGEKWLWARLKP
ncbi:ATP-binding protein [Spirillospora sp. CA-255316]